LDTLFPGLLERTKKKALLLEILNIRDKATTNSDINAVYIKTLDGCTLSWDYTYCYHGKRLL